MKRKKELSNIEDKEVQFVKSILTQEDVKELFEYKDGDLYWKIDIYRGNANSIQIKVGSKAGSTSSFNYGFVRFLVDFIGFCSINLIDNYIKLVTCLKSLKNKLSIKLLIQYGVNLL